MSAPAERLQEILKTTELPSISVTHSDGRIYYTYTLSSAQREKILDSFFVDRLRASGSNLEKAMDNEKAYRNHPMDGRERKIDRWNQSERWIYEGLNGLGVGIASAGLAIAVAWIIVTALWAFA